VGTKQAWRAKAAGGQPHQPFRCAMPSWIGLYKLPAPRMLRAGLAERGPRASQSQCTHRGFVHCGPSVCGGRPSEEALAPSGRRLLGRGGCTRAPGVSVTSCASRGSRAAPLGGTALGRPVSRVVKIAEFPAGCADQQGARASPSDTSTRRPRVCAIGSRPAGPTSGSAHHWSCGRRLTSARDCRGSPALRIAVRALQREDARDSPLRAGSRVTALAIGQYSEREVTGARGRRDSPQARCLAVLCEPCPGRTALGATAMGSWRRDWDLCSERAPASSSREPPPGVLAPQHA